MTMNRENPGVDKYSQERMSISSAAGRKTISSAERWLLITEKAYSRIQRRGFVGGDPIDDWLEAEREVDTIYDTDARRALMPADAQVLIEAVKDAFGGYNLGHLNLDAILEKHRDALIRLAEHNSRLIEFTSELATRQAAVVQDALNQAMETLQAFSQGKVSVDGFARQAELTTRAMENLMSYFQDLTESATGSQPSRKSDVGNR